MPKHYFDLADKARYANHLIAVLPTVAQLDPIVTTLLNEHCALRDRLQALVTGRDDTRSSLSMSRADRRRLDAETVGTLRSLLFSLKGARSTGTFDLQRFFPNGTLEDIGRSVAERKASLERCISAVAMYPSMPDAERWQQTLTDLRGRYNPKVDEVSSRDERKRATAAELDRVRAEWRRHYRACKCILEGLLIRAGLEDRYVSLFLDLQQASGKGTSQKAGDDGSDGQGSS